MPTVNWFVGDSKEALKQMMERNCAFLVYMGKEDDELTEILSDPNIIQLLNNQLILCYKMDPASPSFKNFQEIFNDAVVPSIYLLEKNNIQQFIIKTQDSVKSNNTQLDMKRQLLNAIHCTVKCIADTIKADVSKQKYIQYLTDVTNKTIGMGAFGRVLLVNHKSDNSKFLAMKLQIIDNPDNHDNPNINKNVQQNEKEVKKLSSTTKLKIKIPSEKITKVQEFQTSSSLNDVKTFILNNFHIPNKSIKFIAHRQFVDEDFSQSLEALNLCPSSTIYVHIVPPVQWLPSIYNFQSRLWSIVNFVVVDPCYFILGLFMDFFGRRPPVAATPVSREAQSKRKSTYKPVSNIHQLKTNNSDDDENNTYNGNSTQQL